MVENTRLSQQYFSAVQKFVVLELGLTVLPVSGQTEAAQLIAQIVSSKHESLEPRSPTVVTDSDHLQVHSSSRENPFRRTVSPRILDPLVLAVVQKVPGVGGVKALALLQKFSSLQQLSNATSSELEPVVGRAAAQHIHSFFNRSTGQ